MPSEANTNEVYLGFLSVTGNTKQGLVGGFLLLNKVGRPIEFHCTAPVRPNRAQEILYGNTLSDFLYSEQIAQALIKHSKSNLFAIITDIPQILSAQENIATPIIFAAKLKNEQLSAELNNLDNLAEIKLGNSIGILSSSFADANPDLSRTFSESFNSIDPLEPFERIRSAIEEAQKGV